MQKKTCTLYWSHWVKSIFDIVFWGNYRVIAQVFRWHLRVNGQDLLPQVEDFKNLGDWNEGRMGRDIDSGIVVAPVCCGNRGAELKGGTVCLLVMNFRTERTRCQPVPAPLMLPFPPKNVLFPTELEEFWGGPSLNWWHDDKWKMFGWRSYIEVCVMMVGSGRHFYVKVQSEP